jgi:hypothetical protein
LNRLLNKNVNWLSVDKCQSLLILAGFSVIRLSGHGQSLSPLCRDLRYFDTEKPFTSFYLDIVR